MVGNRVVKLKIEKVTTSFGATSFIVSHDGQPDYFRYLPVLPEEILVVLAMANAVDGGDMVHYSPANEWFCAPDSPPSWRLRAKRTYPGPPTVTTVYEFAATEYYAKTLMGDENEWLKWGRPHDSNAAVTM